MTNTNDPRSEAAPPQPSRFETAVTLAISCGISLIVIDNFAVVSVLIAVTAALILWYRGYFPILLPLLVLALHWGVGSTRTAWRDSLLLLAVYSIGVAIRKLRQNRPLEGTFASQLDQHIHRRFSLVIATALWLSLHVADYIFQPTAAQHLSSRDWVTSENRWPEAQIGLALSGGGFRAALYHTGVIMALERNGIRPAAVSSVSGGSIIAAYYTRGGDLKKFVQLVEDGGFNLKRRLLAPWAIARMILSVRSPHTGEPYIPVSHFSRLDVQAALLSHSLFGATRLTSPLPPGAPQHVIATTDLLSGDIIGLMPEGLVRATRATAPNRGGFVNRVNALDTLLPKSEVWKGSTISSALSLSEAVAASGAFPIAFEPLSLEASIARRQFEVLSLGDGGLADNMGTAILFHLHVLGGGAKRLIPGARPFVLDSAMGVALHLVIASDASALTVRAGPTTPASEIGSAVDAIYRTSGGSAGTAATDAMSVPLFLLSPETLLREHLGWQQWKYLRDSADHRFALALMYRPSSRLAVFAPRDSSPMHHWTPTDWRGLSFTSLTLDDLRFIISLLPTSERVRAEALLPQVAALTAMGLSEETRFAALQDTALYRKIEEFEDIDLRLFRLVSARVAKDLTVFIESPTLKDNFSVEETQALVRLGAFVATWHTPDLRIAIDEATRFKASRLCRQGRVAAPACPPSFMRRWASPP